MIFTNVRDWSKVEADLREQGFTRMKLKVVHELWYRLQLKNLLAELNEEELEEMLELVVEAYENK